MPRPSYLSWFDQYAIFYSPVTFSLLDPKILLSALFSNIVIQCSSLSVRDRVYAHIINR
jgi:hypothetical protein